MHLLLNIDFDYNTILEAFSVFVEKNGTIRGMKESI